VVVAGTEHQEMLLREVQHRCSNDLQLVLSLIKLGISRSGDSKVTEVLTDLGNRVRVLADARASLLRSEDRDLATSLREVCESLQLLAEPKSICIKLTIEDEPFHAGPAEVLAASLAVNELVTNALKHAFEHADGGRIDVTYYRLDCGTACIAVEDDGSPLTPCARDIGGGRGMDLGLVRRLIDQQGGMMIAPAKGSKRFELRFKSKVPAAALH
jgi:two-component sensor histidine kinase